VALLVIVLGYVAFASFVAIKTPAWESSDEPGHVSNIEALVGGHWYGIDLSCRPTNAQTAILSCNGDEAQQAPLYYAVMAGWQEFSGLGVQHPPTHLQLNKDSAASQEFFLSHQGDWSLLLWLRFGNVVLGAATVLMAFVVTKLVARDAWTPAIASALVAFLPGFVFLSGFVKNDNLVMFLGAVLTFCALRFSRSTTTRWMIATGAVFGLLLTTKLSTAPVALIVPFLAFIGASSWRRRLSLFAYGSLSALAVSGWYLVQNWVRYGDPDAGHASLAYMTRLGSLGTPIGVPYVIKDPVGLVVFKVPTRIVTNFWYSSGWGQFDWPLAVGFLIALAVVLVLFGLIFGLFNKDIAPRPLLVLGAISVLSLGCVWFMAFQTPAYGVRFAYVGLVAMAAVLALAVQRWPVVLRWLLPAAGIAGCLVAIHQDVLGVHWT
jgi:4-amino-4-deoxy-L-arabinose transferase-like glycosyltransferase